MTEPSTFQSIIKLLDDADVEYQHISHEPTPTSQDAARVRGVSLEIGGKSLLLKADDRFHLFVFSGARRLDSNAARAVLGVRKSRFATAKELYDLTGLVPGSVPPFGRPILPVPLYVDHSIVNNDRIAFNAGSLTDSIIMTTAAYQQVATIEAVVDVAIEPPTD